MSALRTVHVLPDHVANQIAAGEVVERPASVVKELVENALDAGATRVRIEVEDGGRKLIRIVDDGCGMTREDAVTALLRHATSKIAAAEDLTAIGTLGFRGEALPSIRSVSRFRLRTRTHDHDEGTVIRADGAEEPVIEPIGAPPGTEIVVEELFFNVPARRKFLKQPASEMSRIADLVDQLALAWPGVGFVLVHGGRVMADYPAEGPSSRGAQGRMLAVFGREIARRLYRVELTMGALEARGFLSEPTLQRPNATMLHLFVNGRPVRDKVIQHAVTSAYGEMMDRGRYPVGVLELCVPPELVDVNVHPAKAEVRFAETGQIHSVVQRAIRLMLAAAPWARPGEGEADVATARPLLPPIVETALPQTLPLRFAEDEREPTVPDLSPPLPGWITTAAPPVAATAATSPAIAAPDTPEAPGFFMRLEYIGQVGRCFLVCQSPSALHLIDQHAAHERVSYERLKRAWLSGSIPSQRLLFPDQLTLEPALARAAEQHAEVLQRMGFDVAPFGARDFVVTEVPAILQSKGANAVLVEVLSDLAHVGTSRGVEARLEHLLATLACHGSVRAGDKLEPEEARSLLKQMDGVELRANCPHGRPVLVSRPFDEVARWFGRT